MNKSTLAIAIAALLVGGVAVAAFQHMRQPETVAASAPAAAIAAPSSIAMQGDQPAQGRQHRRQRAAGRIRGRRRREAGHQSSSRCTPP